MLKDFFSNIYVATVKKLCPNWVVKNKLVKTNREASKWLMGAEKEVLACHQLNLSEEEIAERHWSLNTRIVFLKDEIYACVDDLSTADELNIVFEKAICDLGEWSEIELQELGVRKMTPDILVRAIKKRTPSAEALKTLIQRLNVDALLEVAEKFPQAFNDLKAFEILGLNSFKDMPVGVLDKRFYLASLLCKRTPKLAMSYLELLYNIPDGQISGMAKKFEDELFEIAFECNFDLSNFIDRYYSEQPDKYVKLRKQIQTRGEHLGGYVNKMFYELVKKKYTDAMPLPGTTYMTAERKQDDAIEAYYWMRIAMSNVSDRRVFEILFDEMDYLRKVLSIREFEHLLMLFSASFFKYSQAVVLLEKVKNEDTIYSIRERIISFCSPSDIARFYPFAEWTERQVSNAIVKLINDSSFPVERINLLSDKAAAFAKEKLLTRSQMLVLNRKNDEVCRELFAKQKLTPEAECFLMDLEYFKSVKKCYIEKHGLSPLGFKHLLRMNYNSYECKNEYLQIYAQKFGLTEEQLLQVMQSNMAGDAMCLSQYVKKND